jgi:glycogenin glucosyltransferase
VTLATTDDYASGALVLARSLRAVSTSADLVCLISSDLNATVRAEIVKTFDEVIVVDVLNSHDDAMLALLKRPELGVTLTKVNSNKIQIAINKYSKSCTAGS